MAKAQPKAPLNSDAKTVTTATETVAPVAAVPPSEEVTIIHSPVRPVTPATPKPRVVSQTGEGLTVHKF